MMRATIVRAQTDVNGAEVIEFQGIDKLGLRSSSDCEIEPELRVSFN
jgi:hypothetical protein